MLEAVNDWTESIDEGAQVDVIYLDYAKAFDRVPHDILLGKLVDANLNPNLIKWIRSYLSNRTFSVKVNNESSTPKHAQCGVPQGAVLPPILFGIFVKEIPSILPSGIRCKQFADDIKIYTAIPKKISNPTRKLDCKAVESVQNAFTRRLYSRIKGRYLTPNDPDYLTAPQRNSLFNLSSLESRRQTSDRKLILKMIWGQVDIDTSPFFTYEKNTRTRAKNKFKWNHCKTKIRRNFFVNRTLSSFKL
uniref:Reverse transcriptase domain-containing protein n=1 Tax=Caenorhabditis japonica TaxID=281687 RepID=A0A8R1DW20_CAEJA